MVTKISQLPKRIKDRWATLIGTALGLFLALRFNDFFRSLLDKYLPEVNGLWQEFAILMLLSVVILTVLIIVEDVLK